MKKKDLLKKMENLETPHVENKTFSHAFKLRLISARKSANFGILLVIVPIIFITGMLSKYNLGFNMPIVTTLAEWIGRADRIPGLNYVMRFILLGGPLIAIIINLLSILHFYYSNTEKELVISIKLKWKNLLIVGICLALLSIFFLYLMVENIHHP